MRILAISRIVLMAMALLPAARGHEIGTTRVSLQLSGDSTYQVEIVTNGAALAEKLEAFSGRQPGGETRPDRLQSALAGFDPQFRQRVDLAFDAPGPPPEIQYRVEAADNGGPGAVAIIRLSGPVPARATRLTFMFGWIFSTYSLTVRDAASGTLATVWLEGGQLSEPFAVERPAAAAGWFRMAVRYLTLGFTHILPNGLDHMLFVLGIYLLNSRPRSVLLQVSAFTLAHSITLGLGMYGLLSVSPAIVEPLIALSIAYVAIENVFLSELRAWRVALVFAFGLLHGLGFSGALTELSLQRSEFVTALLTFNIGVEAGQLTVIAAAFLLVGWRCSQRSWYRHRVAIPASALIACMAVYWTFERLS